MTVHAVNHPSRNAIEPSPAGATRERAVPCARGCGRTTWNFTAVCSPCRRDDRDVERLDVHELHDAETRWDR